MKKEKPVDVYVFETGKIGVASIFSKMNSRPPKQSLEEDDITCQKPFIF